MEITDFLGRSRQKDDAASDIVSMHPVSVVVYRNTTAEDDVGFGSELNDSEPYRYIEARIEKSEKPNSPEDDMWVALVTDDDVQMGDRWLWTEHKTQRKMTVVEVKAMRLANHYEVTLNGKA